jgi:glucose-6-phosphate 1-epimerase
MGRDFAFRTLINDDGCATFSDYGAQLLRWAPAGQPDVVWSPSSLYAREGGTLAGGVPIVFPWFGPGFADGRQTAKQPIHGFARMRFWRLDAAAFTDRHVRFTLDSSQLDEGDLPWLQTDSDPHFTAVYDVTVGESLTMALTVTNTGEGPLSYEAALHSYLHVGNVSGARLAGLAGADYLDATRDGFPLCMQDSPEVGFGGEVDRVYYSDAPLELHDGVLGRTVHIGKAGSAQSVVWNPGQPYGTAINPREAGQWRNFVCVEAAACRDRMITLEPGESHVLSQTLSVEVAR